MTSIPAAAALAAALLVAPAAARDRAPPRSRAVTHADLDLGNRRGIATLDRRIRRAARELCGTSSALDIVGRRRDRACAEDAVARVADARGRAIGTADATPAAGR